jgi:hypothetical protein
LTGLRDIFDIIRNDIKNHFIKIDIEVASGGEHKMALERLCDDIEIIRHETPDKIEGEIRIDRRGHFIKKYFIDVKMTEEVYDSIYSIHGGIIEECKDKETLVLSKIFGDAKVVDIWGDYPTRSRSRISARDNERHLREMREGRFRDYLIDRDEDADGDFFIGSWGRPLTESAHAETTITLDDVPTYENLTDIETIDLLEFLHSRRGGGIH